MVLGCQVPAQQPHGGQRQLSRGEPVEDDREAAAGPGRLDPAARCVFGEPKGLGAITKERAVALGGVEGGSAVESGQMGHELGGGRALPTGQRGEVHEEVAVR